MAAVFCQGTLHHSGDLHADCHYSTIHHPGPAGLKSATLIHDLQQGTVAKPAMRFTVKELLCGAVRCTVLSIQILFLAHKKDELSSLFFFIFSLCLVFCPADWQTPE